MSETRPAPAPAAHMLQMIVGHWPARALHVMANLAIADAMSSENTRAVADIAADTATHAPSLARLLRLLATLGVVRGDIATGFALTELGATLRSDAPNSVRDAARLMGSEVHYAAWGALERSIRSGEAALTHTAGATLFDWLAAHPDECALYNRWMAKSTRMHLAAVRAALDVSDTRVVVDVAGGSGALLAGLLDDAPAARGVLLDTQADIELDPAFVALQAQGRVNARRVDILDAMEPGGDVYLLKFLLHAVDDARAIAILRRCGEAMAANGRVAIIEMLVPHDDAPHRATLMDLNMLVLTEGGRERTEAEYRTLCAAAGLTVSRVTPTPTPLTVIEARRAP